MRKRRLLLDCFLGMILFFVFFMLFYKQATTSDISYPSDLQVHIQIAERGHGYSLLHWLLGIITRVCANKALGVALFESAIVVATWIISSLYVRRFHIGAACPELIACALLFLCSCFLPIEGIGFYIGGLVTQPWHNITFFGMRLLSVATMFGFMSVLSKPDAHLSLSEWLSIATLLMLTTAVKPNFLITFAPTVAIFIMMVLIHQIRAKESLSKELKKAFVMGSVILPALAILWLQSRVLYKPSISGEETSGIALTIIGSKFFSKGPVIASIKLARVLTFPAIAYWVNRDNVHRTDKFNYLHFAISILVIIVFTETGKRANHGNFYWCVYNAGYLLFLWCVPWFIESCLYEIKHSGRLRPSHFIGIILLAWHFLSGVAYFISLMGGSGYGI